MAAGEGSWDRFLGPRVSGLSSGATWALLATALTVAAAAGIVLLDYGVGRDQAIYRVVAAVMAEGGAPYLDAWDFKPPGIFAVYALARGVFGPGESAVRVIELLGLLSLLPAFWLLSRRALGEGRAGLLGASLAVLAYVPLGFWDTAQPEGFGGVLLAWALVFATVPDEPGRRTVLWWTLAGALYGAAALLKPHLGAGILVSVAFAVANRSTSRLRATPVLAFVVGGLLPIALTLGWFSAQGALVALHEALFVFAPHYTALNLVEPGPLELLTRTAAPLLRFGTPELAGLIALFALPLISGAERRLSAHVLAVALLVLLGVGVQAKFFPYHYAAVLLLLALPAGWGFWKLWLAVADRPLGWLLVAVGAMLLLLPFHPGGRQLGIFARHAAIRFEASRRLPPEREAILDRLHSLADVDAASNRRVARWLERNTSPHEPIYIWGFEPGIYDLAGRRPASRFIYNVPQRAAWSAEASRHELMEELAARPPAAIVVVTGDRFPHVTGSEQDGAETLRSFFALSQLIDRHYAPATRIGDIEIHRRADAEPRP
jgi:hypothetical protein